MVLIVRNADFARFPIICYHFKHPGYIIVNGGMKAKKKNGKDMDEKL